MSEQLIDAVEASYRREKVPRFEIGDTVTVHVRIREGDKQRIQPYNGVVIARRGRGLGETFIVRHIDPNGEGVERIFPIHSPTVAKVQVRRHGKVRRAKLYFLRERVGKARRLRERRSVTRKSAAESKRGAASSGPKAQAESLE